MLRKIYHRHSNLILILLYISLFALFVATLVALRKNPCIELTHKTNFNNKIEDTRKQMATNALVDQLKENKNGYSNNVWQTLATLVLAIGMVLGSDRVQEMLKSDTRFEYAIQLILIPLYALHGCAYFYYLNTSNRLKDQLDNVSGLPGLYSGYQISSEGVAFNLLFDTVLFLLLAYIVDHTGKGKQEKKK